ncbi:MAG: hypothetical protein D6710_06185 [Nitrospirae bacterium]|nr:MAG: hypothetical protein D6710_06185 [Nitrospirota bacterium]
MIKRALVSVVLPIVVAFGLCYIQSPRAGAYLRYHLGLYDLKKEEKLLRKTIKQFNIDYATVFNTGGTTYVLDEYPAANLVKRRTYQEANIWAAQGLVLVYDRDKTIIEGIRFYGPFRAVVVAKELWFINFQDIKTRKYLSPLKADRIRVRYLMKKVPGKGWIVQDYEVYSDKEKVNTEVDKQW